MSAIISAEELGKILRQPHVRVLDASYNLPPSTQGIPGALDFDIDDVADSRAPLAHTIPSPQIFSEKASALGIGNQDLVIVYDRSGMAMAAARAWWMFRLFGHDNVRILNGGLPAWIRSGGPLDKKSSAPPAPGAFKDSFRPELLRRMEEIRENVAAQKFTLLDARDSGRFKGEIPDPRPGTQTGHVPGALNIPFPSLLNVDGTLKPKEQLEKTLQAAGVPVKSRLACSCGSGVTACMIALALYELGVTDAAVYDGSWSEWGSDPSLPKAQGA